MIEQSWILGFAGGLIIGGAAALYLLIDGRIMGASGIIGGLVDGTGSGSWLERSFFLAGLIVVPGVAAMLTGGTQTNLTTNVTLLVSAGLLVGVGTRLANGCTSGHGVCGISRLSLRGIVATVFYLFAGGLTMLLFRHVWGVI